MSSSLMSVSHRSSDASVKKAVLLALNYTGSSIPLGGCEIDASRMDTYLKNIGYETTMLKGNLPTKANFVAAVKALAATPGLTHAVIYYAGHGTQLADNNGDETDGYDECLVFQSSKGPNVMPGASDLMRDDDVLLLMRHAFAGKTVDVSLMFDSCHSGSICDLGYSLSPSGWTAVNGWKKSNLDTFNLVCISGCTDDECSMETSTGGGVATTQFLSTLSGGNTSLAALAKKFAPMSFQRPQISAAQIVDPSMIFAGSYVAPQTRGISYDSSVTTVAPLVPQRVKFMAALVAYINTGTPDPVLSGVVVKRRV